MKTQPSTLLSSYRLGDLDLKNRIVMAPMTRSRALEGNVPNPLAATYYAQRASAGLIVTEATQVSPRGVGYIRTPGMHTAEQVAGWRRVTDAVHAAGGVIFAQLWHVGRISHPDFHGGELPVAPSAIAPDGEVFTANGRTRMVTPRALETSEIPGIVEEFRRAAANAKAAGFDGVELHGANGYLIDQFLRDGTNRRTDRYGGSVENRARFAFEVAEAVISVWGARRVGIKISPHLALFGVTESNPAEIFGYLTDQLSALGLLYLHVSEARSGAIAPPEGGRRLSPLLRRRFQGTFIANGGYDAAQAEAALVEGESDLVAFGVPFIANPDLPARFRQGAPLSAPDPNTFYMGEDRGYTDYPALQAT